MNNGERDEGFRLGEGEGKGWREGRSLAWIFLLLLMFLSLIWWINVFLYSDEDNNYDGKLNEVFKCDKLLTILLFLIILLILLLLLLLLNMLYLLLLLFLSSCFVLLDNVLIFELLF